MRQIKHPGPVVEKYPEVQPSRVKIVHTQLQPGDTLLNSVKEVVSSFDCESAVLRVGVGMLSNFAYYIPALSDHPEHAVFFSEKLVLADDVTLEMATITYGRRNGEPWLHCHAVWLDVHGHRCCGHLVPDEVVVSSAISVEICLIESVCFEAKYDPETNFSIFKPTALNKVTESGIWATEDVQDALVIRAIPNLDFCETLEQICTDRSWTRARVCGGVGSINGVVFADGRSSDSLATELLIEKGFIDIDRSGKLRADIDITLVDYHANVVRGTLARQVNPVLVTCELVLVSH